MYVFIGSKLYVFVPTTLNARMHFTRSRRDFCHNSTSYSLSKNVVKGILLCEIPGILKLYSAVLYNA